MVQIVNVLKTSFKAASCWARYVSFTRFNTRIPAITPSVKVDRSRLAAAKPKANPIPAEYESPIATLLAAEETRRSLGFSLEERDVFRRRIRLVKYNGGARYRNPIIAAATNPAVTAATSLFNGEMSTYV